MKRLFLVLLCVFALCGTAHAQYYDYTADVYKVKGTGLGTLDKEKITSGVTYEVLQVNTDTRDTLYSFGDTALGSKTNPITTTVFGTDAAVKFRTSQSTVDLLVTDTAGGFSIVINDFSPNMHQIVIDERDSVVHHGVIRYSCSTTGEVDTGIDFKYDTQVLSVMPEIVTTSTGGNISVGLLSSETSGDADGFLITETAATAGYPAPTIGDSGALMDDGTDFYPTGHFVTGANAVSLTYTCDTTVNSGAGYIHYNFSVVR